MARGGLTLGAVLLWSASASAQTVTGVVRNGASGEPVADASVTLLDDRGRVQRGWLTEADGAFTLAAPRAGTFKVRAGARGYAVWDSQPLKLDADKSVELDIVLVPESGLVGLASFEQRRAGGKGTFFTEQEIKARGGAKFTDVLRHVPGVAVRQLNVHTESREEAERSGLATGYHTIRLATAAVGAEYAGARQLLEPGADCPPVLFVNGAWWGQIDGASPTGPDDRLPPSELVGIEIYQRSEVPAEFSIGRETQCGVIAVWTKKAIQK
jgi:hypothetical protein